MDVFVCIGVSVIIRNDLRTVLCLNTFKQHRITYMILRLNTPHTRSEIVRGAVRAKWFNPTILVSQVKATNVSIFACSLSTFGVLPNCATHSLTTHFRIHTNIACISLLIVLILNFCGGIVFLSDFING